MSGAIDASLVPTTEQDITSPMPVTAPVEDVKPEVTNSECSDNPKLPLYTTDPARPGSSAATDATTYPSLAESVLRGPVVENVKDQHVKTKAELSNLAATRKSSPKAAATGQQLSHYHSFFTSLLSWQNPRASGIAFASIVVFIFAARYLNILRYAFKLTWMTLGVTVLAEAVGKTILGSGLTSQFRPRKYYTISKETIDSMIIDFHEFINFFVIESQRILFAENLFVSAAAFLGAFFSYFLIKFVPFWGLALISTSTLFLGTLLYKTNKELIDYHLTNISDLANQQTEQVKQIASHHAARATDATKQYVGDYSAKAQELLGNARGRPAPPTTKVSPILIKKESPALTKESPTLIKKEDVPAPAPQYEISDFPAAPKEDFEAPTVQDVADVLKADPLISA